MRKYTQHIHRYERLEGMPPSGSYRDRTAAVAAGALSIGLARAAKQGFPVAGAPMLTIRTCSHLAPPAPPLTASPASLEIATAVGEAITTHASVVKGRLADPTTP